MRILRGGHTKIVGVAQPAKENRKRIKARKFPKRQGKGDPDPGLVALNRAIQNREWDDSNCEIPRSRLNIDRLRFGLAILNRFSAIALGVVLPHLPVGKKFCVFVLLN